MRYIGGMTGQGTLKSEGENVARVSYDLDGFSQGAAGVTGSGEILLPSSACKSLLGVNGLQLQTDDGKLLDLKLAAKDLASQGDSLHVDIIGGLPTTRTGWRH